jgi:hypothetical protein
MVKSLIVKIPLLRAHFPMDLSDNIVDLLAKTAKGTVEIATIVGCDPSYVSQVKAQREVEIAEKRILSNLSGIRRDNRIDELEDKALEKLGDMLGMMFKPMEVLRAAQVLNGMTRRTQGMAGEREASTGETVVRITLPSHVHEAVVGIKLNTSREVVEVNGRQMLNLPMGTLLREMETRRTDRKLGPQVEQVTQKKLPHEVGASDFHIPPSSLSTPAVDSSDSFTSDIDKMVASA